MDGRPQGPYARPRAASIPGSCHDWSAHVGAGAVWDHAPRHPSTVLYGTPGRCRACCMVPPPLSLTRHSGPLLKAAPSSPRISFFNTRLWPLAFPGTSQIIVILPTLIYKTLKPFFLLETNPLHLGAAQVSDRDGDLLPPGGHAEGVPADGQGALCEGSVARQSGTGGCPMPSADGKLCCVRVNNAALQEEEGVGG